MGRHSKIASEAKGRLAGAVRDVESRTSAEVVVAVQRHSGDYTAADLRCACLAAFLAALALYLLPHSFEDIAFLVDPVFLFLLAFLSARRIAALRRLFTSSGTRSANVRTAALATFMEHGVGRLPRRNGLLVYASQLERRVEVVLDTGIDVARLGASWPAAVARLEASLRPAFDLDAFESGLKALGPLLGKILPHTDDDLNELPDEAVFE